MDKPFVRGERIIYFRAKPYNSAPMVGFYEREVGKTRVWIKVSDDKNSERMRDVCVLRDQIERPRI